MNKKMNWKRKRFLIPVLFAAFLILIRFAVSRIERHPSLATTLLPNGKELRLHAVLQPTDSPFLIDSGGLFNRSPSHIHNPRTGLVFVFSCRDPDTGNWLGFDWFHSISVRDRFGLYVQPSTDGILVNEGHRTLYGTSSSAGSLFWDHEYQVPLPNPGCYRFLTVSMATPEVSGINEVTILDSGGNDLAKLKVNVLLPPADLSFKRDQISFVGTAGSWRGEIFELTCLKNHTSDQSKRSYPRVSIRTKLDFERDGSPLFKGDFVRGPSHFTDPMGNTSLRSRVLPYGPKVWKYSTSVARNNSASFSEADLMPLGTFKFSDSLQQHEYSSATGAKGLLLVPAGDHEFKISHTSFLLPTNGYDTFSGTFAMGSAVSLPRCSKTHPQLPVGRGGYLHAGSRRELNMTTGSDFGGEDGSNLVGMGIQATSETAFIKAATKSKWPLVLVAIPRGEDKLVHHLIVKNGNGNRLPVYACFHPIQFAPLYAVDTTGVDEQPLAFFYHSEPLQDLEFTIPSPHTVINRPESPDQSFDARLVPDGDSWLMISN